MNAPLRLTGPADLIATLPYQLGFQPKRCLIVVCFGGDSGKRLGLIQRIDLAPEAQLEVAVDSLAPALLREEPYAVVIVGYEDTKGEAIQMVDAVAGMAAELGIRVKDSFIVRDGRLFTPTCTDPQCCPPEGTVLEVAPAIVAEYVARGVAPLQSREALEASIEATPEANAQVIVEIAEEMERQFEAMRDAHPSEREEVWRQIHVEASEAWGRILTGTAPYPADSGDLYHDDVAAAVLVLIDGAYRDALMNYLTPGLLPPDVEIDADTRGFIGLLPPLPKDVKDVQRRLVTLCATVPDGAAAPPLTVLASYAWWLGDGALTVAALKRALRCDPEYPLAQLLSRMVAMGLRPDIKETA